jgi:hypothetical protein
MPLPFYALWAATAGNSLTTGSGQVTCDHLLPPWKPQTVRLCGWIKAVYNLTIIQFNNWIVGQL